MFINQALAQTTETAEMLPEGTGMKLLFQFVIIFAIFYFILIRPQTKRMKEHKREINAIGKGDKIICGGIVGKVAKVSDTEVEVEIAPAVKVTMIKEMVASVISKAGGPIYDNSGKKDSKNAKAPAKAEELEKALTSDDDTKKDKE
ncbi:MAG: preprotein translocase subunit YajC [Alphaproteobacteria bacterium]|nr:preprotein translocase subunit YajC [Alphaproteobacteria bacterium]